MSIINNTVVNFPHIMNLIIMIVIFYYILLKNELNFVLRLHPQQKSYGESKKAKKMGLKAYLI